MANCSRIHSSMASELLGQLRHTAFGLKSLEYLIGQILSLGPCYVIRIKPDRGFFLYTLHKHVEVYHYHIIPCQLNLSSYHTISTTHINRREGISTGNWRESQKGRMMGVFCDSANVAFCPEEFDIQHRLSPDSSLSLCQDKKEEP